MAARRRCAHEALFREWTRLQGWLEPERARLEALRSLRLDAAAWDRSSRDAVFLNHRGKRLEEGEGLTGRERYAQRLTKLDHDYLAACRVAARTARCERRRMMILAVAVTVVGEFVIIFGVSAVVAKNKQYLREQYFKYSEMDVVSLRAEKERALRTGDSFHECATRCPEMVVIPAGQFAMGSPDGKTPAVGLDEMLTTGRLSPEEKGRYENDGPQHEVRLEKPFAVSKYEVTFAEWEACVAASACPAASDSGYGKGNLPVINVNWEDAQKYTDWLSRMTGKHYRLLSEAEWEYTARAGSQTAYSFGDSNAELDNYAWYTLNSRGEPHPVGEKKPNAFGLYDMHGNVWEWVEDSWNANYGGAPNDGSAWRTGDASLRVLRGGSWGSYPQSLLAAYRYRLPAYSRDRTVGFRVSRTLNP